jgi:hypothetical protein
MKCLNNSTKHKTSHFHAHLISGDQIEKNEISETCSTYGRDERSIQAFGAETDRKRPLGRPRYKREDNIKMDIQGVGCRGMDWIDLAQDKEGWRALVNAVMNLRVP